MFTLPDHESAKEFFAPHLAIFKETMELAIPNCDDVLNYSRHVMGEPVDFHANIRTPFIHPFVQFTAAKLFRNVAGVEVVEETNGTTEFVFENKVRLRFQKVNDDLTFSTSSNSQREQFFRNRSSQSGFLDFSAGALFPVYAGYRLRPSGEFRDIYLMHYDHNERQWHFEVDTQLGDTTQELPWGLPPVAPVVAPDQMPSVTPKRREL